jgi:LuxR family transcriptional regulator, maltose regulon positive regulatory protein
VSVVRRAAGPGAGGVVARPGLWERLGFARVTVLSAPPGSGKTVLLRSWITEAGLDKQAGWVTVSHSERNPQLFWLAVLDALRATVPGSVLVGALTAAPDLDGWAIVERLLKDLAPLDEPLWLVVDDLQELGSDQARRQLELLLMRAPDELRFVLATRHDVQLGLHRLRLEGELAEIRADDLRFSLTEASALFAAAGVELTDRALALLVDRTEGWAAGLRLAALSLAGHPDPERFAAEFSGTERTVAEYLLAEVLERQSPEVRRLLLHTSVLQEVSGELADLLTGESGGERVLQDLEEANAFVVSLDAARSWFRYHHLFAGLLQLELRRAEPGEVTALHSAAAGWFAGHGFPVEAVRHAQAAHDWGLAARLLADHWPSLYLDGQAQVLLGVVRLLVARQRGNPSVVVEEARRLRALPETPEGQPGLGEELRAVAAQHLEQGVALARRIGRPYLEFTGLAYWAAGGTGRRPQREEHSRKAIELARRHGWTDETAVADAYAVLANELAWQGRLDEAEVWAQRAERTLRPEAEPAAAMGAQYIRGQIELARGRAANAVAGFRAAERLAGHLAAPPDLLERHAPRGTANAAMIAEILDLQAGNRPAPRLTGPPPPLEPLSKSELRVLRYLPTHLTAPEIAGELSVSLTTVKTHLRNLYGKLGAHRRAEAVERARAVGLLAPSAHQR